MAAFLLFALLILPAAVFPAFESDDVNSVKPCNVSLFSKTFFVVMGERGFAYADGDQTTLEELNNLIDVELEQSSAQSAKDRYIEPDSAKMFFTSDYGRIIFSGQIRTEKNSLFRICVFNPQKTFSAGNSSGFLHIDSVCPGETIEEEMGADRVTPFVRWQQASDRVEVSELPKKFLIGPPTIDDNNNPLICDPKTVDFEPATSILRFDGFKFMDLKLEEDDNEFELATMIISIQNIPIKEQVGDFYNRVRNHLGDRLYAEPEMKEAMHGTYFFNQLESGKFKLQLKLGGEEDFNGERFFVHILTRLDSNDHLKEVEQCYVRKIRKNDDGGGVGEKYMRMLIIPKQAGSDGVPIPLLTLNSTDADSGSSNKHYGLATSTIVLIFAATFIW